MHVFSVVFDVKGTNLISVSGANQVFDSFAHPKILTNNLGENIGNRGFGRCKSREDGKNNGIPHLI